MAVRNERNRSKGLNHASRFSFENEVCEVKWGPLYQSVNELSA